MKDVGTQFFSDDRKIPIDLGEICDDSTRIITIATPEDWKCSRKGCAVDYLHTHTTYSSLATQPSEEKTQDENGDNPAPKPSKE